MEYYRKAVILHGELGEHSSVARATGNIGDVYNNLGDYPQALSFYMKALAMREDLGEHSGVAKMVRNMGAVYRSLGNYSQALEHYHRAIAVHEELGERSDIARVTGNIGNVHAELGNYPKALECFTKALRIYDELGERSGSVSIATSIGGVYLDLANYSQALEYFTKAYEEYEKLGKRSGVARAMVNIGSVYGELGNCSQALEYFTKTLGIYEELGDRSGVALVTANIGTVYVDLSEYPKALKYLTRALAMHEELGERSGVADATGSIGSLYAQKAFAEYNPTKAEELLQQAIALNEELGIKQNLYKCQQSLAELYEQEGRFEEALTYFKKFHEVQEEVQSEEAKKKAIQVEQQRQIAEMEKRTAAERADAEATKRVLHNILPPTIAQRVVRGEEHIAESFESVTVLFADIVGFTVISQRITPQELVTGLDLLFSQFDELAEKYGLEKIKTIGDAYMAVSGLPESREDHAESAARMAIELVEVVAGFNGLGDGVRLQVRIGLHSGEVVAGIIGKKKFAYDLWGDAVNTASRMESHGEAGRIHVSEEFAAALSSAINTGELPITLEERGELNIKGKGTLRTYFLAKSIIQ